GLRRETNQKKFSSADEQITEIFIFIGQENDFHFSGETNYLTRVFYYLRKYFSAQRENARDLFTISFFVFARRQNLFFDEHKFLIQRKMMKVFSLFSLLFSVGEKTCFVALSFKTEL